jgi:hypothetical protein
MQARYEVTAVDGALGKEYLGGQAPPDRGALGWRRGTRDRQPCLGCRSEQFIGGGSYAVGGTTLQFLGQTV